MALPFMCLLYNKNTKRARNLLPVFYISVFFAVLVITGIIRIYALRRGVMDIPNERSSHVVPTPRGGGMAFVLCFLAGVMYFYWQQLVSLDALLAYFVAGTMVAIVGVVDDHYSISPWSRLIAHIFSAVVVLCCVHGMPAITIAGYYLPANNLVTNILAFFLLVWLINLYNFMDGIDGLAALEAVFSGGAFAFILWFVGASSNIYLPLLLASTVAGFLWWNFPPARIFMGDSGSGFLGIATGIMVVYSAAIAPAFFWSWLILLGVFIVDASFTLSRRALAGMPIHQPHCSHAYQHLAAHLHCHKKVSISVLLLNTLWLFPLALLVACGYIDGLLAISIAYLPLLLIAIYCQAGVNISQPVKSQKIIT